MAADISCFACVRMFVLNFSSLYTSRSINKRRQGGGEKSNRKHHSNLLRFNSALNVNSIKGTFMLYFDVAGRKK